MQAERAYRMREINWVAGRYKASPPNDQPFVVEQWAPRLAGY